MLQEHEGVLSFAMDAWTSPNHCAFVAVTVHMEIEGTPVCLLLDLVEVVTSHSGINLARAFTRILEEFGLGKKVMIKTNQEKAHQFLVDTQYHLQ
jgi:hypothetical protein